MPRRYPTWLVIAASLAAAACFTLFYAGALFVYLPALPLLLLGLSWGSKYLLQAGLLACVAAAVVTDSADMAFFALFIMLPSYYFARKALMHRDEGRVVQWYPVLRILADLTLFAATIFTAIALGFAHHNPGGLPMVAMQELRGVSNGDPEFTHFMHHLASDWSFLLFAATGWSWLLMLYGFAFLANGLLGTRKLALRPTLGLTPQGLPMPLLLLLALCGVLAFTAHGNDRFVAQADLLLLLLPYFLSGLALLHRISLRWVGRSLWLILFYVTLITSILPAFLLVGAGLYLQLAEMLDRGQKMG